MSQASLLIKIINTLWMNASQFHAVSILRNSRRRFALCYVVVLYQQQLSTSRVVKLRRLSLLSALGTNLQSQNGKFRQIASLCWSECSQIVAPTERFGRDMLSFHLEPLCEITIGENHNNFQDFIYSRDNVSHKLTRNRNWGATRIRIMQPEVVD